MRHPAHKLGWRSGATSLALALVLLVAVPSSAVATQLATDRVGQKSAAQAKVKTNQLPDVALKAGILVDGGGTVLWARQPSQRRAMASITKIMTALVALEHSDPTDVVTVGSDVARPGESAVGLKAGEQLTMAKLVEGLLVKSGNDAAVAIADQVAGDEARFVALMNAKAKKLGLTNTRFANSHGLDAQGHYTTAADLQKLARVAMRDPEFRRIVGMQDAVVDGKRLPSTNRLLGKYSGLTGIKTGFTNDAGHSIVVSATREGRTLYAVVLGSPTDASRFDDARALLDWGFLHNASRTLVSESTYVGSVPVRDYLDTSVGAMAADEASATVFDLRGPVTRRIELDEGVDAPVARGQRIGSVVFEQAGREVGRVDLVASRDIAAPTAFERIGITMTRAWRGIFGPHESPNTAVAAP